MAIELSSFINAAQRGNNTVVEVEDNGQVNSSGFFGRKFGLVGQDTRRNQDTMDKFLSSIRNEYGTLFGRVARAELKAAATTSSALTGAMVLKVVADIKEHQLALVKANSVTANEAIADHDSVFYSKISQYLQSGVSLRPEDLSNITAEFQYFAKECALKGEDLDSSNISSFVASFKKQLGNISPSTIEMLNTKIPDDQAALIRPLVIANGIKDLDSLAQAMNFAQEMKSLLPKLQNAKSSSEVLDAFGQINKTKIKVFNSSSGFGATTRQQDKLSFGVKLALNNLGLSSSEGNDFLKKIFTSEQVEKALDSCFTCARLLKSEEAGELEDTAITLLAMHLVGPKMPDGFVSVYSIPNTDVGQLASNGVKLPPALLLKAALDDVQLPEDSQKIAAKEYLEQNEAELAPQQRFLNQFFTVQKDFVTPDMNVINVLRAGGKVNSYNGSSGLFAIASQYTQMRKEQPAGIISPANAWKQIFNTAVPSHVNPSNLAESIGKQINQLVKEKKTLDTSNQLQNSVIEALYTIVNSQIISGVPTLKAINSLLEPQSLSLGEIERVKVVLQTPKIDSAGKTPEEIRSETLKAIEATSFDNLRKDINRMPRNSTINVSNKSFVASADPAILGGVHQQIKELCGSSEDKTLQRAGTLDAMTQRVCGIVGAGAKIASGALASAVDGTPIGRMSAIKVGDDIKVTLGSAENSDVFIHAEYTVSLDGAALLTALDVHKKV